MINITKKRKKGRGRDGNQLNKERTYKRGEMT